MRAPRLTLLAIVAANLVPLFGVAFLGWSLGEVMLLFWTESAIIGAANALRMLVGGGTRAIPLTLFFTVHFGMFMVIHLVFLTFLFLMPPAGEDGPGAGGGFHLRTVLWATLALALSHGVSFYRDFLRSPEARARPFREWMFTPYPRVIAMHLTILGGGFLLLHLGTPRPALAILVLVKTLVDLGLHAMERRRGKLAPFPA